MDKNNGKYFLGGGGKNDVSFNFDKQYFSHLPKNAKILYIPIALNKKEKGYESCEVWFRSLINLHQQDVTYTMILEDDIIPDLSKYDSIYIGGGNTHILLDYIYQKNLINLIPEFVAKGGIYYGGSAGAIIIGKNIVTAKRVDDVSCIFTKGLNKVGGYSVKPHYVPSFDKDLMKICQENKQGIIAIPENSGLIINGENIKVIGSSFLFSAKTKTKFAGNYY